MYESVLNQTRCNRACQKVQSRMPPSQDVLPQLAIVAGIASLYMMQGNNRPQNEVYAEEIVGQKPRLTPSTSAKFTLLTNGVNAEDDEKQIEIRIDITGDNGKAGESGAHSMKQNGEFISVNTPRMQMSN